MQKYLKGIGRFHTACENFARGCEIHQFCKAWEIPSGLWKFLLLSFVRLVKFHKGAKFILHGLALCTVACTPLRQFARLRIFCKGLRNCWMLDSFFDSLPCILDWFGKDFEALQNLDSSCNLASILLCHGLYQVVQHSWLVLMIKKLSKTPKLAKNWLVTLARVLNVPIELKGNKYYSKVFKRVYKKK